MVNDMPSLKLDDSGVYCLHNSQTEADVVQAAQQTQQGVFRSANVGRVLRWCGNYRWQSLFSTDSGRSFELEKEHTINKFSCDQDKEFVNMKLKTFLTEPGVQLLTTNAYMPKDNSFVEKLNGNLLNKVRAIREATGLSSSL
ncbi:hypothetical protein PC110_g440 [Phytophthora cactorum]|nr:hypothetical protein PC110_g440 [Phytophthora cactorum]